MQHENNPSADAYFDIGCGRCPLGGTPKCKVNNWRELLLNIRALMLGSGLAEVLKWGAPCYTYQGKNVVIIGAFKEYCSIAFFKGALLNNESGLLEKPGENSNAGRVIRLTTISQLLDNKTQIIQLIQQAIDIERSGLKVPKNTQPVPVPTELQKRFDEDPGFEEAFKRLTAGRQKEYLLYFGQAKQSATKLARIERFYHKIMREKGLND
jgi:uncharacterized protein YdeI (YjbR/CyaY-like superfamily)